VLKDPALKLIFVDVDPEALESLHHLPHVHRAMDSPQLGHAVSQLRDVPALCLPALCAAVPRLHALCSAPQWLFVSDGSWPRSHAEPGSISFPQRGQVHMPAATSGASLRRIA
jgi:hypothetical protein